MIFLLNHSFLFKTQTEGLNVDEMRNLMAVLQSSSNDEKPSHSSDDLGFMTDSQLNAVIGTSIFKDSTNISDIKIDDTPIFSADEIDAINTVDKSADNSAQESENDALSDDQQEKIAMFLALTGSEDVTMAKQILQVRGLFFSAVFPFYSHC